MIALRCLEWIARDNVGELFRSSDENRHAFCLERVVQMPGYLVFERTDESDRRGIEDDVPGCEVSLDIEKSQPPKQSAERFHPRAVSSARESTNERYVPLHIGLIGKACAFDCGLRTKGHRRLRIN